jgi:hypothetical protein
LPAALAAAAARPRSSIPMRASYDELNTLLRE